MKRMILLVATILVAAAPAAAYENERTHPKINAIALQRFIDQAQGRAAAGAKIDPAMVKVFAKYDFNPPTVDGYMFMPAGTEDGRQHEFAMWIADGGRTADLPVVKQSLRHFYDPLARNGFAWLTDIVNDAYPNMLVGGNPEVDARTWALGLGGAAKESAYSWHNGQWVLARYCRGEKLVNVGDAWRSIGETMHLLGDMTVPAHVRNDGHPGGLGDLLEWFRGDPYEDYVNAETVAKWADAPVDPELLKTLAACTTPEALFDEVARWTNKNFPSQDTLAGTLSDGRRITNANKCKEYPSPLIDPKLFTGQYYYKTDYKGKLPLAERRWAEVAGATKTAAGSEGEATLEKQILEYPWIDSVCVESQAERLIPAAIAANVRLLELVMPRLEVALSGFDAKAGTLAGSVTSSVSGGPPRRLVAYTVIGGKATQCLAATDIGADGKFSVKLPESLVPPSAAPAAAVPSTAPATPAKAPAAKGSWTRADYFAKLPDDAPKGWHVVTVPPGKHPGCEGETDNGLVSSAENRSWQCWVMTQDANAAQHMFDENYSGGIVGYSFTLRVEEFPDRAAAEKAVKEYFSYEGLAALDKAFCANGDMGADVTICYLDDRFWVWLTANDLLNRRAQPRTPLADLLHFGKRFAGGAPATAASAPASALKPATPAPAPKSLRLAIALDFGGILIRSEEIEVKF
jgi:hypothetical protein